MAICLGLAILASGATGNDLNRLALNLDEATIADWGLPFAGRFGGLIKGDALQNMVNREVQNKTIEQMRIPLGIVATELQSGKGVLLLLEAFKNLVLKGFSHQLVIAGADADITRQQLIEYTQEHQLESRVKILGPVYDAQKHELLQSSDLLVLPSNYDTFGLVLLEAMQFGLPCIATSFGGIPDVLGDGRGILLKERSVGAIEQALEELCEQPELRLQISQKAFSYFHEHFTQACFEKRCRDVLNGKPETLVYL